MARYWWLVLESQIKFVDFKENRIIHTFIQAFPAILRSGLEKIANQSRIFLKTSKILLL